MPHEARGAIRIQFVLSDLPEADLEDLEATLSLQGLEPQEYSAWLQRMMGVLADHPVRISWNLTIDGVLGPSMSISSQQAAFAIEELEELESTLRSWEFDEDLLQGALDQRRRQLLELIEAEQSDDPEAAHAELVQRWVNQLHARVREFIVDDESE